MAKISREFDDDSVIWKLIELITNMPELQQQGLLNELDDRIHANKRKHPRKPFFTVVDYATQNGTYKDFIKNISAGGVFIETKTSFSPGQEISLTFSLPNLQKHVKITGEIARKTQQGIGVKFNFTDEEQKEMVESLLKLI